MKKYSLLAFLLSAPGLYAQITLEYIYDSASTVASVGPQGVAQSQLMIINFEVSGERYVRVNKWGKSISIYDMNHALLKNISMSSFPVDASNQLGVVLYFSEKLFDTDSKIEFMYGVQTSSGFYTGIYKDDGSLIFSDTCAPLILSTIPQQQYSIYNTVQGTKMILSCPNKQAKIFDLPGILSTAIQEDNMRLIQAQGGSLTNIYPNPSKGKVTLQYELPKGENNGEIILYNQQGAELKRYQVDNSFNDLLLDNTMLPSGTYFYQLQTSKGAIGTKKMVVVK